MRRPLLLAMPIIEHMRCIEGWLADAEADLLIAATAQAIRDFPETPSVVEIGSYCGRSTVVLGTVVDAVDQSGTARVYAIDPHDGAVGALDQEISHLAPTLEKFQRNIATAGLGNRVEVICKRSHEVDWDRPICLLLIDALHDYASVARDFYHFEHFIVPGGLVAFHDYADYYPGVKAFVNELLAKGPYERIHLSASMIVLQKHFEAKKIALTEGQERIKTNAPKRRTSRRSVPSAGLDAAAIVHNSQAS